MIESLFLRLVAAVTTFPNGKSYLVGFILLFAYTGVALIWGFKANFLKFQPLTFKTQIARIVFTAFFTPALLEEIVFRISLLPQPSHNLLHLPWVAIAINVPIFVAYHPLNALIFFPQGQKTFFNDTFLSLAGLLGFICIIAYWQSGSLWLPVILHWIVVITWLVILGGYNRLYTIDTN